jgi:hypothetical protein
MVVAEAEPTAVKILSFMKMLAPSSDIVDMFVQVYKSFVLMLSKTIILDVITPLEFQSRPAWYDFQPALEMKLESLWETDLRECPFLQQHKLVYNDGSHKKGDVLLKKKLDPKILKAKAKELLNNERNFITACRVCIEYYHKPLVENCKEWEGTRDLAAIVHVSIKDILDIHERFYGEIANLETMDQIARVFLNYAAFFKNHYTLFFSQKSYLPDRHTKELAAFLEKCQDEAMASAGEGRSMKDLQNLVQNRLTQIRLLFQDALVSIPDTDPEANMIRLALEVATSTIRESESTYTKAQNNIILKALEAKVRASSFFKSSSEYIRGIDATELVQNKKEGYKTILLLFSDFLGHITYKRGTASERLLPLKSLVLLDLDGPRFMIGYPKLGNASKIELMHFKADNMTQKVEFVEQLHRKLLSRHLCVMNNAPFPDSKMYGELYGDFQFYYRVLESNTVAKNTEQKRNCAVVVFEEKDDISSLLVECRDNYKGIILIMITSEHKFYYSFKTPGFNVDVDAVFEPVTYAQFKSRFQLSLRNYLESRMSKKLDLTYEEDEKLELYMKEVLDPIYHSSKDRMRSNASEARSEAKSTISRTNSIKSVYDKFTQRMIRVGQMKESNSRSNAALPPANKVFRGIKSMLSSKYYEILSVVAIMDLAIERANLKTTAPTNIQNIEQIKQDIKNCKVDDKSYSKKLYSSVELLKALEKYIQENPDMFFNESERKSFAEFEFQQEDLVIVPAIKRLVDQMKPKKKQALHEVFNRLSKLMTACTMESMHLQDARTVFSPLFYTKGATPNQMTLSLRIIEAIMDNVFSIFPTDQQEIPRDPGLHFRAASTGTFQSQYSFQEKSDLHASKLSFECCRDVDVAPVPPVTGVTTVIEQKVVEVPAVVAKVVEPPVVIKDDRELLKKEAMAFGNLPDSDSVSNVVEFKNTALDTILEEEIVDFVQTTKAPVEPQFDVPQEEFDQGILIYVQDVDGTVVFSTSKGFESVDLETPHVTLADIVTETLVPLLVDTSDVTQVASVLESQVQKDKQEIAKLRQEIKDLIDEKPILESEETLQDFETSDLPLKQVESNASLNTVDTNEFKDFIPFVDQDPVEYHYAREIEKLAKVSHVTHDFVQDIMGDLSALDLDASVNADLLELYETSAKKKMVLDINHRN